MSEIGAQEDKFACEVKNETLYTVEAVEYVCQFISSAIIESLNDISIFSAKDANCTTAFQFATSFDDCLDRYAVNQTIIYFQ